MSKNKKLQLNDLTLESFVTETNKTSGGVNNTYLGHDCSYQAHCYTQYGNACTGTKDLNCFTDISICKTKFVCGSEYRFDCHIEPIK